MKNKKGFIFVSVILTFVFVVIIIIFLFFSSFRAKIEVNEDLSLYKTAFVSQEDDSQYNTKWGMDESIWPNSIEGLNVLGYKMIYYNPWDAQWVGYLKVQYNDEDYKNEIERLNILGKTSYIGYYGVNGDKDEDIIAMNADDYQGFVYALNLGNNIIVYAEQIFCNYQLDFDYEDYIPNEYLLPGFDAHQNNDYQKKKVK